MDRFYKAHVTDGQPPGVVNFYRMVGQQLGRLVFAMIEGCALVAWQLWKAFHPKPPKHTKA